MISVTFLNNRTAYQSDMLNYMDKIISYSHSNTNNIGYDSAEISISESKTSIELCYRLIGMSVEVYFKDTDLIWSGFVNQVSTGLGNESISFGPYTEIANKVMVLYTEYSTGVPGVTTYANNTDSQDKYGIITRVLNGGSVSSTNANKIRDAFLYENAYPKINKSIGSGSTQSNVINISCLGDYYRLGLYPYNNTSSGTILASEKIKNVLAAQPNSFYSTNYSGIETNSLSVGANETGYRIAEDVIKELLSLGNSSNNNRTIFYVYGKTAYYRTISYDIRYYLDLGSNDNRVIEVNGNIVYPHKITPGYFIETLYKVPKPSSVISLASNPNVAFIESVSYTYPDQYQITSGSFGKLSQQLAKLGISGL